MDAVSAVRVVVALPHAVDGLVTCIWGGGEGKEVRSEEERGGGSNKAEHRVYCRHCALWEDRDVQVGNIRGQGC